MASFFVLQIINKKELDFNKVIKELEHWIANSNTELETELVDYNKIQGGYFKNIYS